MNLQRINAIYNSFPEGQTMSRQEFVKEFQKLTSQAGVQRDLRKIAMVKQTQAIAAAREKQRIDEAIKENG